MDKSRISGSRVIFDRYDWLGAGIAVLLSLTVYIITLAPTITLEDSGEFVTGAATLGILHPPGFPTYALLGKLFTFIPLGSIAWRVNLMSAFFSALTAGLIFFIGRLFTRNRTIAFSVSLLAAFSQTHWSQSVVAEVYSLNSFFIMFALLLLLVWKRKRKAKYLYWFAFVYGLGLTNHSLMYLMAPPYLLYILLVDKQIWKKGRIIGLMFLAFMLGMLPYLYLPIRSAMNPLLDWGNPENLKNFFYHVSRSALREIEFGEQTPFVIRIRFSLDFLRQLMIQFSPYLAWLGLCGIFYLWRHRRRELLATALMFLGPSFGLIFSLHWPFTPLKQFIVRVFYIPAHLVYALWLGAGICQLGQFLGARPKLRQFRSAAGVLVLMLPVIPFIAHFHENNRRDYYFAYDLGINLLKTAKPNAAVIAHGDNDVFTLAYLCQVEKKRPDLTVYDRLGCVFGNPYPGQLIQLNRGAQKRVRQKVESDLIAENHRRGRAVYYTTPPDIDGIKYRQVGILYRVWPQGSGVEDEPDPVPGYHFRSENNPGIYQDYWTRNLLLAAHYYELGVYYRGKKDYEKAAVYFQKAAAAATEKRHLYLHNLAEAYLKTKNYQEAEAVLRECLAAKRDYETAYLTLGNLYLDQNRFDRAEESYRRAIEITPDYERAYYNLGLIFDRRRDYSRAEEMYQKALELDAEFSLPHYGLGALYTDKINDLTRAEYHWKKFLELDPESPYAEAARNNLARIRRTNNRASGYP